MSDKDRREASKEDLVHENEHTDEEPVVLSFEEMYAIDEPDPDWIRKDG